MAKEKGAPGGTGMLLLSLLERRDMYGYEMIEALRLRSNHVFDLKAGTLYPLLHALEEQRWVVSYDETADGGRVRRYYHLTADGRNARQIYHICSWSIRQGGKKFPPKGEAGAEVAGA